jgi:hypothetical protein
MYFRDVQTDPGYRFETQLKKKDDEPQAERMEHRLFSLPGPLVLAVAGMSRINILNVW